MLLNLTFKLIISARFLDSGCGGLQLPVLLVHISAKFALGLNLIRLQVEICKDLE